MKYGMNLLLWTTHVTEEFFPTLEKLKKTGFDGVEISAGHGHLYHQFLSQHHNDNICLGIF